MEKVFDNAFNILFVCVFLCTNLLVHTSQLMVWKKNLVCYKCI